MSRCAASLLVLLALAWAAPASAHPLRFGVLHAREAPDGRVTLTLTYSGSESRPGGVALRVPDRCEPLGPETREARPTTGEIRRRSLDCGPDGLTGTLLGVDGIEGRDVQVLVRAERAEAGTFRAVLDGSTASVRVPAGAGGGAVFGNYLSLGVEHIAFGVDHLLFVLALVLLVGLRWRLVGTITAFTVGHSITLALATLGLVDVPVPPTEAAIALSIVLVAAELARSDARLTATRRWPWLVAGSFGLLHGLGFAGALADVGLPQGDLPLALLAFNLGVEAGQLAFVLAVAGLLAFARRLPARLTAWTTHAPRALAYGIGVLATFWCIERVVAFWA